MKKTRKGLTLIEVLVSIAVFGIISLALISSYIGIKGIVTRQEEYVRLEMIAYDINYYWDAYGDNWESEYFGVDLTPNNVGDTKGYLKYDDGEIVSTTDATAPYYVLVTYADEDRDTIKELIITISSSDRDYVSELNCGEPNIKEGNQ
jgi:prepilin-type N-terminal cleavage/methylation domain-containing protein